MKRKSETGNGEFTVEHEIGIPPQAGRMGRPLKYPWLVMEIGDSFFINKTQQKIIWAAVKFAKNHPPLKFTTRKVKNGLRVWRIK